MVPALLLLGAAEWPEMEVVSLIRRPERSSLRLDGLPAVLVMGTGPPGPPRLRVPDVVLAWEEDLGLGLLLVVVVVVVGISGEEEDMLRSLGNKRLCVCACMCLFCWMVFLVRSGIISPLRLTD